MLATYYAHRSQGFMVPQASMAVEMHFHHGSWTSAPGLAMLWPLERSRDGKAPKLPPIPIVIAYHYSYQPRSNA
jgi:hypothetical protein